MVVSLYPHLESRVEEGVLVLTITETELTGEDLCDALREELVDAVRQSGAMRIVADFRHVKFVASVAFRTLLGLRREVQDRKARLVICSLSPVVAEVFHATGLLITTRSTAPLFEEQLDVAAAIAFLNEATLVSSE
jgi:anti-anti-sigma factor